MSNPAHSQGGGTTSKNRAGFMRTIFAVAAGTVGGAAAPEIAKPILSHTTGLPEIEADALGRTIKKMHESGISEDVTRQVVDAYAQNLQLACGEFAEKSGLATGITAGLGTTVATKILLERDAAKRASNQVPPSSGSTPNSQGRP